MEQSTNLGYRYFYACKHRSYIGLWVNAFILFFSFLVLSTQALGQAGDLSQIRNGDGKLHKTGGVQVLDTCGKCWVNGNAGASNAHYTEGMSIAYRSLITGLKKDVCYEYELGYDTYHGSMAIDYLTHFQRLEPHGPFNHLAEVIKPLVFVSGSTEYVMTVVTGGENTFDIPAPAPSGITSGAFTKTGAAKDISNQPVTSFGSLPAAQKKMTIYNGEITLIRYVSQAPITIGGGDAETRIRVRFKALSDSVVLAWGGHIASRLDWGYTKDNKGKLLPLSAAQISGSPYHMRQKAFTIVGCNTSIPPTDSVNVSGFGNQDRSLSADAVIPPPECPTVTSKTQCFESNTFSFSIDNPEAGATYTWSFGTNSVGATFQGGVNTGNSVNVVANPGADVQGVNNGGSFTLNIVASKNGVTQECPGVATGTVIDVDVDAQDADNTLQINLNTGTTASLGIQSIAPGTTADYNFLWKLVSQPSGANSSITNNTSENATFNVLSPFATGSYVVRVIATQKAAPNCKDSSDVTIVVSGGVPCGINGPATVCPGSQDNVYIYDPDGNSVADPIPTGFTAQWAFDGTHPSAEFDGSTTGNTVKVDVAALGSSCNTSYTVKLTLTANPPGITQVTCTPITVSVADNEAPVITCPADKTLECSATADPDDLTVTGEATATDNCNYTISHSDVTSSNCNITVIARTWTATDLCGNSSSCTQLITIRDTKAPTITCLENGNITVADDCSASGDIVTFYTESGGVRHWTAIDASGNTATKDCPLPTLLKQEARTDNTTASATILSKEQPSKVTAKMAARNNSVSASGINVKAFPNPFSDQVNFRFSSTASGKASLEIYNAIGQKIGNVYTGVIKAGQVYDVKYNVRGFKKSALMYRLNVNDKAVNGKLLKD